MENCVHVSEYKVGTAINKGPVLKKSKRNLNILAQYLSINLRLLFCVESSQITFVPQFANIGL